MDKESKKGNNTVIIVAVVIVIAIVIAIVAVFMGGSNKTNNTNTISAEEMQSDNNSKLAQVQSKIDAQEKVIQDLNEKLSPLVEERTKLEEELMSLTATNTGDSSEQVVPEETSEATEETTEQDVTPAEDNENNGL